MIRSITAFNNVTDELEWEVPIDDAQFATIDGLLPPDSEDPERIGCYLLSDSHVKAILGDTVVYGDLSYCLDCTAESVEDGLAPKGEYE